MRLTLYLEVLYGHNFWNAKERARKEIEGEELAHSESIYY